MTADEFARLDATPERKMQLAVIIEMTEKLIAAAERFDCVVTIETQARHPLRMGYYHMVGDVRLKREKAK